MNRRLYGLLLGMLVLVAAAPTLSQQSGAAISANTPTEIMLDGTAPFDLIYTAAGAETVNVVARSLEQAGVLDPTVEVRDSFGTRLAFNDDHGGSRAGLESYDSAVEALELPGAGAYTIRVTTFSGAGAGRIEVTVETVGTPPINVQGATPAPSGQTISDVLNPNTTYTYAFSALAGQTVTITVRATNPDLDPAVSLVDGGGMVIASNDDHTDPDPALSMSDARIAAVTIPADGEYTVQITGFAGTGGTFDLTIEGAQVAATPTPEVVVSPTPVLVSTPMTDLSEPLIITGEVAANQSYGQTFEAQAGDVFVLSAHATGFFFDPRVSIFDAAGNLLVSNDDHGGSDPDLNTRDARIENYIIPAAGIYTAVVDGIGAPGGRFELTIQRVAAGAPTTISDEKVITGSLQPNSPSVFHTVAAQAGDYVTITARAVDPDFDPRITLLDSNGNRLMDNDDHGTIDPSLKPFDAQIENYHIPFSGNYTIQIMGYEGSSGAFTLTVSTRR